MRVMTVRGPVEPAELGITLPHEHILVDLRHSLGGVSNVLNDTDLAIEELCFFKEAGGGSVVEVTNAPMGRNVRAQERIARETGLHIVAATGFHTEDYYPPEVSTLGTNQLADLMTTEITVGIDETSVRAGIIGEIGTRRDYMTAAEERVFRAAARAHRRTGAPISTHTYLEQLIQEQLDVLEEEGVDLHRVIVGHLGDQRNMDRLRTVAARGAYLGIDHIGAESSQRDDQRAATIVQLIDEGYVAQILISMDICGKYRLHWFGGSGYDYLLRGFVPLLLARGVSRLAIETMVIDNPQRALAFET